MYHPLQSSSDFAPPAGCDPGRCNPSITMMLGGIRAGQEHLIRTVEDIHHAMEIGEQRMRGLDDLTSRLDERVSSLERASRSKDPSSSDITQVEAQVVRWLVYLIPGAALVGTGSWDTATKILAALK